MNLPIVVTIERLGNDEHLHSLDRSREAAPSALPIQLATVEASKGYAPAQVLNALRGVGTPNGAARLIEVGGQNMNRFTFYSILMVRTVQLADVPTNCNEERTAIGIMK